MMSDDVRLEIKGFSKDSKFGSFVKSVVDQLHLEAPSDATTTASFTKFENLVTGAIQISSSQGVFSAQGQGHKARDVVFKTVKKVRKQLRAWKKARFAGQHEKPTAA